ncbi:hypothetical protein AN479_07460 [Serratia marcescens]|nr:hypothetical protein AN479_07460 [Serratia marcescens]
MIALTFFFCTQGSIWIGKVFQDFMEYFLAIYGRRENSFNVLHDKNIRLIVLYDPQVFTIEKMAMIIFCLVISVTFVSGSTYQ